MRLGRAALKKVGFFDKASSSMARSCCATGLVSGSCRLFFTVAACVPAVTRPSAQSACFSNAVQCASVAASRPFGMCNNMVGSPVRDRALRRQRPIPANDSAGKAGSELQLAGEDETTLLTGHGERAVVVDRVVVRLVEQVLDVQADAPGFLVVGHHGIPALVSRRGFGIEAAGLAIRGE